MEVMYGNAWTLMRRSWLDRQERRKSFWRARNAREKKERKHFNNQEFMTAQKLLKERLVLILKENRTKIKNAADFVLFHRTDGAASIRQHMETTTATSNVYRNETCKSPRGRPTLRLAGSGERAANVNTGVSTCSNEQKQRLPLVTNSLPFPYFVAAGLDAQLGAAAGMKTRRENRKKHLNRSEFSSSRRREAGQNKTSCNQWYQ